MKRLEKLKNPKDLAKWICSDVLMDDCDNCPLEKECVRTGKNAIETMLNEEVQGRRDRECIGCTKLFDCFGKPDDVERCLQYEERPKQ